MGIADKIKDFRQKRPVLYWIITLTVVAIFLFLNMMFWATVFVIFAYLIYNMNKKSKEEYEKSKNDLKKIEEEYKNNEENEKRLKVIMKKEIDAEFGRVLKSEKDDNEYHEKKRQNNLAFVINNLKKPKEVDIWKELSYILKRYGLLIEKYSDGLTEYNIVDIELLPKMSEENTYIIYNPNGNKSSMYILHKNNKTFHIYVNKFLNDKVVYKEIVDYLKENNYNVLREGLFSL